MAIRVTRTDRVEMGCRATVGMNTSTPLFLRTVRFIISLL